MSGIPFDLMLKWSIDGYRALIPARGEALDPAQIVLGHMARGDTDLTQGEMFQFQFFIKYLTDVQRLRPDVFLELQKRMYLCAQPDNYFGLRMEARFASSLSRANVSFQLQERPDFSMLDGVLFAECGSVWPDTRDAERDYRERVAAKIRKKGSLRYATLKTLLVLEITSVLAAIATHGRHGDPSDFRAFLADHLADSDFGALLLFSTVYSSDAERVHSSYIRLDAPGINPALLAFLEERYPRTGVRVTTPFVPGQRQTKY